MPLFLKEYRIKNATKWNKEHSDRHNAATRKWNKEHPLERIASSNKQRGIRRDFKYIPLNSWFNGCERHHVDKEHVIHIPKELHQSVRHNVATGKNMEKINYLAYQWLQGVYYSRRLPDF